MSRQHLVPSIVFLLGCAILAFCSSRPSSAQPNEVAGPGKNQQAAARKVGKYQVAIAASQGGREAMLCDTETGQTWLSINGSDWVAGPSPAKLK